MNELSVLTYLSMAGSSSAGTYPSNILCFYFLLPLPMDFVSKTRALMGEVPNHKMYCVVSNPYIMYYTPLTYQAYGSCLALVNMFGFGSAS